SALDGSAATMAYSLLALAIPKEQTVKTTMPDMNVNKWFNAFIVLFTLSFIQINPQYTISKSLGKFASSCLLIACIVIMIKLSFIRDIYSFARTVP
ncbi:hypothetical protein, partial [Psychrobacter sp. Ps4]|uniref:hypothetical protein n=1 Tax=Psychrobacter sp. Ps4 TaxID=2790958 RepID=UPI001EDE607B